MRQTQRERTERRHVGEEHLLDKRISAVGFLGDVVLEAELIEPGERIIVYGDDGIFSRGKEFFVITDKRSIFVNGKKTGSILHREISAVRLDPNGGYPRWKLNNQDSFAVTAIGNKYRLQGAIAALICIFAAEQQGGREKIKLL